MMIEEYSTLYLVIESVFLAILVATGYITVAAILCYLLRKRVIQLKAIVSSRVKSSWIKHVGNSLVTH